MQLKAKAELFFSQTKKRFERKDKVLEQQKIIELEIEKQNDFWSVREAKNNQIKKHFHNMWLKSNVLPPELGKKEKSIEKYECYVASLKHKST